MYFLGVPTTRSPSIVTSDSLVVRDIKYNGNPIKVTRKQKQAKAKTKAVGNNCLFKRNDAQS
jgi:hypothetical protein